MSPRVTIATVARRAGVSRQTVSNVLNAPYLVREETRLRVRDAIDTLGYRTHQAARQLRTGRSRLLAVRIDPARYGVENPVLDQFLHGLTEAAAPAGYRVMLYTADNDQDEIATYEDLLASYALDAFVLTNTHHGDTRTAWLTRAQVPFATFGRPWGALGEHPWVDVDGAAGTAAATRHLLGEGHRDIGFLGWPAGSGVGDDRQAGWERALHEAGVVPDGLDVHTVDGSDEGERAARELLARRRPPTALVCVSDQLALGARLAVDWPVIGFDDTPMARAAGMSSVRQPLAEAAAACVRMLSAVLDPSPQQPADIARQVLLEPHLVIRSISQEA
jgi:DNA-binding LacI/PurR family transcriptional regulator